ncbi:MAG: VWA domain-containing protein [Candidatus Omnitrophica bacterium]|nr:VWA domain-containing protein [Candidatus Omnitrophota bacterium]
MKFGAIYMSMWLWLVPALIIFFIISNRLRDNILKKFSDPNVIAEIMGTFSPGRRKLKNRIIVAAIFLLIIALMRPEWGFTWQEAKRQGIEIIIALDTSKSMLAEDVLPNRLARSKLAIKDLVKKIKGDRIGLIAFSGQAFLQCPLTIDYNGFLLSLDDVDISSIPVGGTSIASAIYKAIKSFEDKKGDRILIVITDGEDLEGGLEKAIQDAKKDNVRIYCVGIGSGDGELIPIANDKGKRLFMKDLQGNVVKTRLNEEVLKKLAIETGGMYVHASGAEFGLDLIYEEKLSKLEKQEFKSRMEKKYHERFQIPLAIAIFLLFLEPFISERKKENGV